MSWLLREMAQEGCTDNKNYYCWRKLSQDNRMRLSPQGKHYFKK